MRLSNKAKHQLAIGLLSDYLISIKCEHLVFSSDRSFDIYVPSSETRIKVFCNYSNSKNLKISNDFDTENGVLYLIITPGRKNSHGFSCVGGNKSEIDNSIKVFDKKDSPKNLQTELLQSISPKKRIENNRAEVDKKEVDQSIYRYIISKHEGNIMPYNIELTDKCRELLLDDYEDYREHGKSNTAVEDEMLRHYLEMAVRDGLVKSYSKKVMVTIEA